MLIWYGHLPEETIYFQARLNGDWSAVSVALPLLRFAAPFFLLMSRHAKTNPSLLAAVSALVIAGQLLDLYWMIMPQLHLAGPVLSWREIGPLLMMTGLLIWLAAMFLRRHSVIATGDPLFERSKGFQL
jgi:hypothetical protein